MYRTICDMYCISYNIDNYAHINVLNSRGCKWFIGFFFFNPKGGVLIKEFHKITNSVDLQTNGYKLSFYIYIYIYIYIL